MDIRPYEEDDWPSIWPIFDEVVAAGDTYAYERTMTSDEARESWVGSSPVEVFVAHDAGSILGTARTGPNRPGPGSHVATASFMVSLEARGRGVGRALGEHVLRWAAESGYAAMQFNAVVETNTSALALWLSLGFEIVGTVPDAFAHPSKGLVGLHIMHRYL